MTNNGGYGLEQADAVYEMFSHLPSEYPVNIQRLSDNRKPLSPTFEGKQVPFMHYETVHMKIYKNNFEAWWSGIAGPTGNALLVTAGLIRDPEWSLLLTAAGFGLAQTTDDYLQVDRQVLDLWNNGYREVDNPSSSLDPSDFELVAVNIVRVRQVNLWATDDFGSQGFMNTSLRPMESIPGERLEISGVFRAL